MSQHAAIEVASMNNVRKFDPAIPLRRKVRRPLADTEDRALSAYALCALREARSCSERPFACPHCSSPDTLLATRAHTRCPRPSFKCRRCKRRFNRLTGTPLARLRHEDKLYAFVPFLSQQVSYAEVAEILEVDYSAIANWAARFREWLLVLDATGTWEKRVRIGIKPRPAGTCPRCSGTKIRLHGFETDSGGRRLRCESCSVTFQLKEVADSVTLVVAYDPALASGRLRLPETDA